MNLNIMLCPLPASGDTPLDRVLREILGKAGYCIEPTGDTGTQAPVYLKRGPGPGFAPPAPEESWRRILFVRDLRDTATLFAQHLLEQGPPSVPAGYRLGDAIEMVISHNLPEAARRMLSLVRSQQALIVRYEDLADNPARTVRCILDHCDVPADDATIASAIATQLVPWMDKFHETVRPGKHAAHFDALISQLFRIFLGKEQLALGYRLDDLAATPMPVEKGLSFFSANRRPYYIWAHSYRQSSAGIRSLHYLCHALNEMGEEAYITPAPVLNPSLKTPRLTIDIIRRHFLAGQHPVALYPEVISGNPFATPVVARWLLNRPGHIGGDTDFDSTDLLFHFARWCIPESRQDSLILNLPTVDTAVFNNEDNVFDGQRAGACYYANKYLAAGGAIAPEIENGALSLGLEKPRTPEELAEIFRQSEVLYCYELSSLIPEALSCGCPVLIVPSEYWQQHGDPGIFSGKGIELASTPDALAKAKAGVRNYRCTDDDTANYYWWQIQRFVATTQAAALPAAGQHEDAAGSALWMLEKRERRTRLAALEAFYRAIISSPKAGDAPRLSPPAIGNLESALIADRLRHPATIELIVVADEANRSMLSATLASIVAQQYPALSVTVVTPVSLAERYPQPYIRWQCVSKDQWSPARQALQESNGEWCGIIRSGDVLVRGALALFACQAEANPSVHVLYSDECAQENADSPLPPSFHQAFDIDLVRSGACTFGLLLARKDAWKAAGGWRASYCGLDTQDALLRLWETCGDAGFDHVAGALYLRHRNNRPFLPTHPEIAEIRRQIVREHLSRSGTAAEITAGQDGQLEHIEYRCDRLPKVSLVIATKDNREGLETCIRSILDRSDYPDLEILVIDNGTTEARARAYLDHLAANAGDMVRVTAFNQPFNLGTMYNAAAQLAGGELLLFMHDDTEVLSHGWLKALATHCLRPGVAMAGALLVANDATVQEAGIVAMQFGITANPMTGKSLESEDPTGLLHKARQVSAISSACMMVRREVFIELGGMDAGNFPARAADIDFCLKLRAAGHRIMWTPDAVVLHDSDGSLRGNPHDNNALLEKWGDFLTDDPCFNPWLALGSHEYAPETDPALQPDPIGWHPLPSVYGALLSGSDTEQQRVEQVIRCATGSGLIRGRVGHSLPPPVQLKRLAIDLIHCCAPLSEHQAREIEKYRRLLGCRLVLDIDTLLDSAPDAVDPIQYIRHTLQQHEAIADQFTTSSHWLADQLAEWVGRIAVVADGIDPARWKHPGKYRDGEKLRVGWHGRPEDLESLVPVIMALTNEVDWIFVGAGPQVLAPCVREQHYLSNMHDLPRKLAGLDLDLAICPLAMNALNPCRSHLPALEYGALAIPVVATDIAAYQTGLPITLTSNTVRGWTEAIRAHAADRAACRRSGEALRDYVMTHCLLPQTMSAWQEVWQKNTGGQPSIPSAAKSASPRSAETQSATLLPLSSPLMGRGGEPGKGAGTTDEQQSSYQQWLAARHAKIMDAGPIFANHSAASPTTFHLILRQPEHDTALLAETLDSLGQQQHPHWHLDVVTTLPPPAGIDEIAAIGWHCLANGEEKHAIDSLVESRNCDWIAELPSGAVLDPLCLWRLATEARLNPDVSAFFVDDDVYDTTGLRQQPRFKPGVNQEWLQCTDLAGPLFVRRATWTGCGGASSENGSPWFDLLIRIAGQSGWKVLGHVADVLISYPEQFPTDIKSCLTSLVGKLHAEGGGAEIVPAAGRVWRIRNPLAQAPAVSIAILSQGQVDMLSRCLDCLVDRTRYPDFEIIISLTDKGLDPELDDWLATTRQRSDCRIRTVSTAESGSHASRCNAAIGAATNELVLLLREEAVVVQAGWLEELVRTICQPGIAAVSPCLISPGDKRIQNAGHVLGLNGLLGSPYQGQAGFDELGYLGYLQVCRDASVLPAACMLIRKEAYLATGGMDEIDLGERLSEADLCRKLSAGGQRLLYQPLATVLYRGSSELAISSDAEAQALRLQETSHAERTFAARWLKPGSGDPYWNPNLSLTRPVPTPETDFQAGWQFLPVDTPKIFARTLPNAQGEYRINAPLKALSRAGQAAACIWEQGSARELSISELLRLAPDTAIVQHYLMDQYLGALQEWTSIANRPFIVYSLDDLITNLDETNPARKNIPANSRTRFKYALERCDRLVVSTDFLAETYRHFIADIRVVPNRLAQSIWLPLQTRKRTGRKPRIGWAGGTTHQGDLMLLKEVIEQTRDEADWIFFGMCPDAIRPLLAEYHELAPVADYPALLASLNLDIAVAPLALTPFNRGKSNLRLLEYGALGIPVVCSDIDPYRGSPACLVQNTVSSWVAAIRERIHDADAREQEGRILRKWVHQNYLLEDHLDDWLTAHIPN